MLISKKMTEALNQQVGREFGAMLQYVAIASYFEADGLPELAHHFARQAEEERDHAMRIVKYVVDADAPLKIPDIPAPHDKFGSAEEAVSLSVDWEMQVTEQINSLVDMAIAENDHLTKRFLDWFVTEQLEEVSSMDTLLRMIRRAGESGLMFVESHLARRLHGSGGGSSPAGG